MQAMLTSCNDGPIKQSELSVSIHVKFNSHLKACLPPFCSNNLPSEAGLHPSRRFCAM